MRQAFFALAAIAGVVAAVPAAAQETMETVAVTGYRTSDSDSLPYVVVTRRADHLYTTVTVEDDTRDEKLRTQEMRETLKALIREAKRDARISLSVEKRDVLKDFTEELIDSYITNGSRPDTSRARIMVKTPIAADDTFDSATGRIDAFVKRVPRIGRSETNNDADWELTVVGPQQYHPKVIARIAETAKQTAAMFGPEYGVHIDGLQRPLQWFRSGQLELSLYIPYTMTVQPK